MLGFSAEFAVWEYQFRFITISSEMPLIDARQEMVIFCE
jgi:hypothetical protein